MSKYFSNIEIQDRKSYFNDLFTFDMKDTKDIIISSVIGNCVRRVAGLDIPTYSVSPESFVFTNNTSQWDKDRIIHQLSYLPIIQEHIHKMDLNMIELHLDIKNDSGKFIDILSNEIKIYNKESKKYISNDKFLPYDDYLLIEDLGPLQEIKLKCQFEYNTKRKSSAIHQAATVGMDYDLSDGKEFPDNLYFLVTLQVGISPKTLISNSFDVLINRIKSMEKSIKENDSSLCYIEVNRNNRYDFVFIGEDHTMGSLIEKWNNRHDSNSVTGYRLTTDKKSIKIDYGLSKFSVGLKIDNNIIKSNKFENLIEKSITSLTEKEEKKQKDETVKSFLINLDRIRKYLLLLKTDFEKVKVNNISLENFNKKIENGRFKRLTRLKKNYKE